MIAAACGSGADGSVEAAAVEAASDTAGATSGHLFPDVETLDVATGASVNLATELAGGDTPVLLWFWAPH